MPRHNDDGGSNSPDPDGSLLGGGHEVVSNSSTIDFGFGGGELVGLNDKGMHNQREQLLQELDKQFFDINTFEKAVIGKVRVSFYDGIPMQEVMENFTEPKVGITFMAGADTPLVNLNEQVGMTQKNPDQKDAVWRVRTAGALLRSFDVSMDMTFVQTDNTPAVIASARGRKYVPEGPFYERNPPNQELVARIREDRTVTIDSDNVKIVNDLSDGKWDLESTLIEVDQPSLVALMFNYRHLIHRGGPALTFAATIKLLDMMIEDARRLCVRSPILFRMSTRRHIISSKNTRYGVDHGTMFQTLTTSSGIKNIISQSAAYFNSLASSGDTDRSQELIRPRFLQMLVLLLSLLNDKDLEEIAEFLETTYRINAERQHIELLILKVLPLMSINSKIFLHAMVAAFEGPTAAPHPTDQAGVWNTFVQRTLQRDYILPGIVEQLGQPNLSWVVKWPETGFKDSSIFNNLQYAGSSRTVNEIPPINLHFEKTAAELTIILTNGSKYLVDSVDVENIIRMTPGKYPCTEAPDVTTTSNTNGRTFDLEITEKEVTVALCKAINRLNSILQVLNPYIASARTQGGMLRRISGIGKRGVFNSGRGDNPNQAQQDQVQPFPEVKGSGKLTWHQAILHDQRLAMAYKIEGRKIGRRDLIRSFASDLRKLRSTLNAVNSTIADFAGRRSLGPEFRNNIHSLRRAMDDIQSLIGDAEREKAEVDSQIHQLGDEPVEKVLYPSGAEMSNDRVWHDYKAWYVKSDNVLYVEAQRRTVQQVTWVGDEIVEIVLHGHPMKYFVSPLKKGIAEHERLDEVKEDDNVLLLGQFMVVVEALEIEGQGQGYAQNGYARAQMQMRGQNGYSNGQHHMQHGIRRVPINDQEGLIPQERGGFRDGYEQRQSGFEQRQNGFEQRQNGFEQRQNGFEQRQNGLEQRQNGFRDGFEQSEDEFGQQPPLPPPPQPQQQAGLSLRYRRGQAAHSFAFAHRHNGSGGAGSFGPAQGHGHRYGNNGIALPLNAGPGPATGYANNPDRNVMPMATEGMVNWLKITGVEQQASSRRGMHRQRAIPPQRSAIR